MNMASLEAVMYPQDYPVFYYRDWGYDQDLCLQEPLHTTTTATNNWDSSSPSMMQNSKDHNNLLWDRYDPNSSSPETNCTVHDQFRKQSQGTLQLPGVKTSTPAVNTTTGRRKRRRAKNAKNKEEIENQRMTHIAVERNRRKQMNEYLAVLRSLMPRSYVQRGDQASIIGGAINFVKELEQLLQSMEANKRTKQQQQQETNRSESPPPFAEFFTFPQYSTHTTTQSSGNETMTQSRQFAVADIEVTMVESHANLKILSKKRPKQLLLLVSGLQGLRLTVLHLNVTTVHQMVMYSISLNIEEGCQLSSVDEIAAAVNQMLRRIGEDSNAPAFS